jgi:hypothetical protein
MTGNETDFMGRIRREMDKYNTEIYMEHHCTIDQESLCGKTSKYEHVMRAMVSAVNFIRFHGLHHCQLLSFCRKLMLNMGMSCTVQKSDI